MGFCSKWINWLMLCVNTVSYEVCFTSTSIGPIIPKCRLRQGDLLSPYLFMLCIEGLSNSLNQATRNGVMNGCRISPSAPVISHLFSADDSFLFFKATMAKAIAVKSSFVAYEQYLSQSINF